jgi:hypothetical protein
MVNTPALRLRGRNSRIRAYRIGRWNRDPLNDVAISCRSSVAADKALAESVSSARRAGKTWPEIAEALGLSTDLTTWAEVSTALGTRRQMIFGRHIDEA